MSAQTREEAIEERHQLMRLGVEERLTDMRAKLVAECLMADHSLRWWKAQERESKHETGY